MADCNACGEYRSIEDLLRRAVVCDTNGGIALRGTELNVFDGLAPTLLSATAISDVQIDLAWTVNSMNRDGHRIYISTDNVTFTEKGTVLTDTATYSATGLTPYTIYYFKVVAYKLAVESDPSIPQKQ